MEQDPDEQNLMDPDPQPGLFFCVFTFYIVCCKFPPGIQKNLEYVVFTVVASRVLRIRIPDPIFFYLNPFDRQIFIIKDIYIIMNVFLYDLSNC